MPDTAAPEPSAPTPSLAERLLPVYPALGAVAPNALSRALSRLARAIDVPRGTPLFSEGEPCPGFPLVLTGEIRVARGSAAGRQIELYRVGPGELCVVSASCLFGHVSLGANGCTTAPTTAVLLEPEGFDELARDDGFRRFVFATFGERLAELMALTEAVAFQRLDQRLATALLGHGPVREVTHQALADELGTVREIVTRLLKRFERSGWIRLARERIEILDAPSLRSLSLPGGERPG